MVRAAVASTFSAWRPGREYRLVQLVGVGAYGEVAEAIHIPSGDRVAVKRIPDVFSSHASETDVRRLLRELFILRHMRGHPNVIGLRDIVAPAVPPTPQLRSVAPPSDVGDVPMLDLGSDGAPRASSSKAAPSGRALGPAALAARGSASAPAMPLWTPAQAGEPEGHSGGTELYLVFDCMDTDMNKLILSAQALTPSHVQSFMYQMLLALLYLHSARIVHRDCKPANVLLNADCTLSLCDFGLSRILPTQPDMSPTSSAGTASLNSRLTSDDGASPMASPGVLDSASLVPELILLLDYSTAVDMWSAGCIFAELLQMIPTPGADAAPTAPLFPGRSCFPLSAEHRDTWSDSRDQLNVILDVIGTPSDQDVAAVPQAPVRAYLAGLPKRSGRPLQQVCPAADPLALDLLSKLLAFNPAKRLSVPEALAHPFFASIRDRSREILPPADLRDAISRVAEDTSSVRQLQAAIQRESRLFRREMRQIAAMTESAREAAAAEAARHNGGPAESGGGHAGT